MPQDGTKKIYESFDNEEAADARIDELLKDRKSTTWHVAVYKMINHYGR